MKVNTVEQYKIMEFIEKNFEMNSIKLEIICENIIKITDHQGDSINFKYENGKVIY